MTASAESDSSLIDAVRQGDTTAYGHLYRRHLASAYNQAYQLCRGPADADDLVAEAFANVLGRLTAGHGPDSAFRAYLLTAIRHLAYGRTRESRKIELADNVSNASGVRVETIAVTFTDPAVAALERHLAVAAFRQLPDRWRKVLVCTEIEDQLPAEIAPEMGLTPNGVASLAYRARKGLRSAYLQAQLRESNIDRPCRSTFARLGAWTCDNLAPRHKAQVKAHLRHCGPCRRRVRQLADNNPAVAQRRCTRTGRPPLDSSPGAPDANPRCASVTKGHRGQRGRVRRSG